MNNNKTETIANPVPYLNQRIEVNTYDSAKLLKALANESRLSIVCLLNNQEMSVSHLNHQLALSQSALSQHLAVLRKDGLVKTRRESQTIFYSLDDRRIEQLLDVLGTLHLSAESYRN